MADLIPLAHFDALQVPGNKDYKISIKKFVESSGKAFKVGHGFYQLSKPEIIQLNKRILVQRISDPENMIIGKAEIRKILNIPDVKKKNDRFTLSSEILEEFNVFVQSTSYNRNLIGGTTFLFEKEVDGSQLTNSTCAIDADNPCPVPSKRPRRHENNDADAEDVSSIAHKTLSPALSTSTPGNVEVVISFDTTTSMYPCLSTLRTIIRNTLKRLTAGIPGIRIGIVAHGDYDTPYAIIAANDYKFCSADELDQLIQFVTNAKINAGGGTYPECYELALREIATKFNWSLDANKSVILIGDDTPHEPSEYPDKIDWRQQCEILKQKGIRVYAVQCLEIKRADSFYRTVAKITLGFHLRLHQFSSITDFLTAVFYKEGDQAVNGSRNLEHFETELTTSGKMVRNLRQLFDTLQGRETGGNESQTKNSHGLVPVSPSRFQVLDVDESMPIKKLAETRGLVFLAGRGFYEFTKPEIVSDKKEIVLMEKATGDFYSGWDAAREFSGIEAGNTSRQKPTNPDKYIVFIQSTSYNRNLVGGSRFLYEIN